MKILLVITKGEIGGAQSFVLALVKGLKRKNIEVSVAFGDGDYLSDKLKESGIEYHRLNSLKRSHNPFKAISFIKELRNIINEGGFDVVHLNSSNALFGAISAKTANHKVRTVFTVHGLSVLDDNYKANIIIKKVFKAFFKIMFGLIDKVVFVSRYNMEAAERKGMADSGELIYNGIEKIEYLDKQEARKAIEDIIKTDLDGKYVIGSIGRLAYPKNYEFLINIFPELKKEIPNAKVVIIGEGSERAKYEKLIKENNLEQDFFLAGSIENASKLVKAFDVFVLPSIYEGLSISLIEAVSAQVPAIASNVGGNSEIIGEDNCFNLDNKKEAVSKIASPSISPVATSIFGSDSMVDGYISIYNFK